VYEQKFASGDHAAADIVKDISPNAWQHVHLIGAFDFDQAGSGIDIDPLAAHYDDPSSGIVPCAKPRMSLWHNPGQNFYRFGGLGIFNHSVVPWPSSAVGNPIRRFGSTVSGPASAGASIKC
jgi:hypothetical protein